MSTRTSRRYPLFQVRAQVYARWKDDGLWYKAQVTDLLPESTAYVVLFTEYGNTQVCSPDDVLPPDAMTLAAAPTPLTVPEAAPEEVDPVAVEAARLARIDARLAEVKKRETEKARVLEEKRRAAEERERERQQRAREIELAKVEEQRAKLMAASVTAPRMVQSAPTTPVQEKPSSPLPAPQTSGAVTGKRAELRRHLQVLGSGGSRVSLKAMLQEASKLDKPAAGSRRPLNFDAVREVGAAETAVDEREPHHPPPVVVVVEATHAPTGDARTSGSHSGSGSPSTSHKHRPSRPAPPPPAASSAHSSPTASPTAAATTPPTLVASGSRVAVPPLRAPPPVQYEEDEEEAASRSGDSSRAAVSPLVSPSARDVDSSLASPHDGVETLRLFGELQMEAERLEMAASEYAMELELLNEEARALLLE